MTKKIIFILVVAVLFLQTGNKLAAQASDAERDTMKYLDGQSFTIIGKYHSEKNYARFPKNYESKLRKDVWDLGQHSAGISIRFRTNARDIIVRWTVLGDNTMDHMPATGIKGIDLYAFVDNKWKYISTGRVKGKVNQFTMVRGNSGVFREYLLNLPLYDGIDSLSIGVNNNAEITLPSEKYLIDKKPVVYYGSSIAQGGCASRPGMAYTNILSRMLDRSFINMGFSGSGTFDIPVGEAMSEINASLYIIDCNPNTKTDLVYQRAVDLVKFLKEKRPEIPILLVEGFYYVSGFGDPVESDQAKKNAELKRAYNTLREAGLKLIYYRKGQGLIGDDYEGTVDGVHPNDLGMMRMAESLRPTIQRLLK